MKKVVVLGATGSIGSNALDVIESEKSLQVTGLSVNSSYRQVFVLAEKFSVKFVQVSDPEAYAKAKKSKPLGVNLYGPGDLDTFLQKTPVDIVLSGISGSEGLKATVEVLQQGLDLALANKESLVMAGKYIMKLAKEKGCKILPVDSEHSSLFRLLQNVDKDNVKNIWLTASGGPFLQTDIKKLSGVTTEQACSHPNWKMGKRISVDSATMFNKVLEVVEAYHFFGFSAERIKVIIHPQSHVHSLLELKDGSFHLDASFPDMRLPISYALNFPKVVKKSWHQISPQDFSGWDFVEVDKKRFPLLDIAYQIIKNGNGFGAIMNAADEEAVSLFLQNKIAFTQINKILQEVSVEAPSFSESNLEAIWTADKWGRQKVLEIFNELK